MQNKKTTEATEGVEMRKFNPIMEKFLTTFFLFHLILSENNNNNIDEKLSDVPVVSLELGTNQQSFSSGIKEGADVYFECNIKANPPVYKINWKQNVSPQFSDFSNFPKLTQSKVKCHAELFVCFPK